MASAEVHQPNEFAVPQAKAATNGPNLTNSAIFSAGLTSPIFSKTAAAQSSDPKDHLKFSGFFGARASGTFPAGLSTSGLFNLASSRDALALAGGLTGSGNSFPTGIPMSLSGIFPFPPIPAMPLHASGDNIAASPSSASGSATDVTNKPPVDHHHHHTEQAQAWKHASTGESSGAHFNAFTPFFRPLKSSCTAAEQPMAFWKTGSNELLCFNESFLALIEVDPNQLQHGFRWTDLRVVDRESREVRLNDDAPNALKVIYEFGQQALNGTSRFAQVNFSFFCGSNKLKHIALTLVAMPVKDEVLWLIQELGVEKANPPPRPPAGQSPDIRRAGKPPAETSSAPSTPSHSRHNPPSAPATDPMERKLVKVPIRKKKPWDQNLVKFSLKKARKRSKRSAASRAAALAAAAEEQHSHDSHDQDDDQSPELPSASHSPAAVRASPRVAHHQPHHQL